MNLKCRSMKIKPTILEQQVVQQKPQKQKLQNGTVQHSGTFPKSPSHVSSFFCELTTKIAIKMRKKIRIPPLTSIPFPSPLHFLHPSPSPSLPQKRRACYPTNHIWRKSQKTENNGAPKRGGHSIWMQKWKKWISFAQVCVFGSTQSGITRSCRSGIRSAGYFRIWSIFFRHFDFDFRIATRLW